MARQVVHLLLINALSSALYSSYPDFFPTQIILRFLVGQRKVVVNPIIAGKKKKKDPQNSIHGGALLKKLFLG